MRILFDGGQTNVHDSRQRIRGLSSVVIGGIEAKIEAKTQEDRHDCAHFYLNS